MTHLDEHFANYISKGLRQGFHINIGFRHGRSTLRHAHANMKIIDRQAVRAYLTKELEEDRVVQMTLSEVEAIQCSLQSHGNYPPKN